MPKATVELRPLVGRIFLTPPDLLDNFRRLVEECPRFAERVNASTGHPGSGSPIGRLPSFIVISSLMLKYLGRGHFHADARLERPPRAVSRSGGSSRAGSLKLLSATIASTSRWIAESKVLPPPVRRSGSDRATGTLDPDFSNLIGPVPLLVGWEYAQLADPETRV